MGDVNVCSECDSMEGKFFEKIENIPDLHPNCRCYIEEMNKKLNVAKKADVQQFINKQIAKHEQGSYIRWLDEWEIEGSKNPTEYFKSPVVQEFLKRIDNKTFYIVIENILGCE